MASVTGANLGFIIGLCQMLFRNVKEKINPCVKTNFSNSILMLMWLQPVKSSAGLRK